MQPREIFPGVFYVGANDRRIALFESAYPVPRGVSYNSYLVKDEKTALLDTADKSVAPRFLENVAAALGKRKLDYLIINHAEPDHGALIADIALRYPEVKIVGNAKTLTFLSQFFDFDISARFHTVAEGDKLNVGKRVFTFVTAPMVHWPEVMMTYDATAKILYSADAFGSFGALNGNLFADEIDFENIMLSDARRYYTNIVGKYGPQVRSVLQKASALDIAAICPLHGPIWRENIGGFIDKYSKWSAYEPESASALIIYSSVYGHTEEAADLFAGALAERGIKNIATYDVSVTHYSEIVAEAFRCSHILIATTTYNAGIFTEMERALTELKARNLSGRAVAIIENGTWAPTAADKILEILGGMKDTAVLGKATLRSALKSETEKEIIALADKFAKSLKGFAKNEK